MGYDSHCAHLAGTYAKIFIPAEVRTILNFPLFCYKQTKNSNETGSNLSLGTRLTVLSKRLGRKRCCDTTPDRCLRVCRLSIFASHYKKMLYLLPKIEEVGGIPGPEAYQMKKWIHPTSTLAPYINSLPKVKFSRFERLYQTPKKWKPAFQKCKLSNSFFKMQLQNCVFPNFHLQILSSKSNLRSSFANLFNFKFSKTCWKSPKLYTRSLTDFEKK